jgi:hypothetical protein
MSTLYVDTITEKTSGNGVQIPGHVVQVVQDYITDVHSYNAIITSPVATALTASITPKSASSKILVMIQASFSAPNHNHVSQVLKRTIGGSTVDVGLATNSGNRPANTGTTSAQISDQQFPDFQYALWHSVVQFLDTPSTTSPITYQLYWGGYTATQIYLNRTKADRTGGTYDPRSTSSVTLMEIAQ